MSAKTLRISLLLLSLFIGFGALYGSGMMIGDPSGEALQMKEMLPYFEVLPWSDVLFQDYLIPGIALLVIIGVPNIWAFSLLFLKYRFGAKASMACGILLMLWICIQFIIFPFNPLSTTYFILGLIQTLLGIWLNYRLKTGCFTYKIRYR